MANVSHCEECGCELNGEAAYIEMTDKILCHPCADALDEIAWEQKRYFVSQYTDGPATRWNVIDRQTQKWVRRFPTKEAAQQHADKMNADSNPGLI